MGVVDELREMAREVVPYVDDQEERDVALGKFVSFNRTCFHTYYWLPALERLLEGSQNEMSAARMARHETTTVGSLSRTRMHSGDTIRSSSANQMAVKTFVSFVSLRSLNYSRLTYIIYQLPRSWITSFPFHHR